jgi:hypothetical protein
MIALATSVVVKYDSTTAVEGIAPINNNDDGNAVR